MNGDSEKTGGPLTHTFMRAALQFDDLWEVDGIDGTENCTVSSSRSTIQFYDMWMVGGIGGTKKNEEIIWTIRLFFETSSSR